MAHDPIERLSDAQRDSLRLFQQGFSVKEIALRLGRAPVTIEKRLEAARKELGVATSREAARLLTAFEQGGYGRSIYGALDLSPDADPAQQFVRSGAGETAGGGAATLREDRVAFDYAVPPAPARPLRSFILRSEEQRHNDLTPSERLISIFGLTASVVVGSALFIIAVVLLMDFLLYTSRHGS